MDIVEIYEIFSKPCDYWCWVFLTTPIWLPITIIVAAIKNE